jgi:hypothetical protein
VDSDSDPGERIAYTVNVASPNKENYKQFRKYSSVRTLYMGPWSEGEIITCFKYLYPTVVSEEELKKRFSIFGGIPRLIFSIDEVFSQLNQRIAKYFLYLLYFLYSYILVLLSKF